ncbi:MAG: hypothetical protein ACYC9O_05990 [Candidatus Latescibacterota bacterium]
MKVFDIFLTGLALTALAGCSSLSTVDPRAMTVNDVILMTRAEVGPDVIKRQIEATRSRFLLTTEEIVRLKKEGVDDDVLTAMIDSETRQDVFDSRRGASPYDFWFDYYNSGPLSYGYGSPYIVYQQPGLIGRFYSYYPLSRRWTPYYDPERDNSDRRDGLPLHPGTGQPLYPDRQPPNR